MSISTDIIVGFPGETEDNFINTMEFSKKMKFTKIHVFPYSRRHGTKADAMPNQIDEQVKKDRVRRLIEVDTKLEYDYLDKHIGEIVDVLIETNDGISSGHTGNNLKVIINKELKHNEIYKVKILRREYNYLIGEVYED